MAGERVIQCVGPSYWQDVRKTAVQRSVNLYMMQVEGLGEDSPLVLESAPGLSLVNTFGADVRGMHATEDYLYIASGSTLYKVDSSDNVTTVDSLSGNTGRAEMMHGTGQLAIVDGTHLDVLSFGSGIVTQVTSPGWLGSNRVDFLDGYFIFSDPGTETFFLSAIDDASSLDALDFSSSDSQPDDIVAHIVIRRELYLMGSRSIEVWVNSGGVDFPLVRYQSTPMDAGVVGPYAVASANDSLVWVGKTPKGGPYVFTLNGYQPVRISTQAVEQQLMTSTDLSACTVWAYQDAGGEFICIDAPGMETTWVWDAATRQWHERGELSAGAWSPSRIECHAYFNSTHYVCGGTKLYKMSRDYRDLAGDALVRERTWPHLLSPSLESVPYHSLELRCTTGDTTAGNLTLEVSNDGGFVFNSPLQRSLGAVGRRQQRVRWMPLGTCPAGGSRVHRLRCSDAVPLTIHGATIL